MNTKNNMIRCSLTAVVVTFGLAACGGSMKADEMPATPTTDHEMMPAPSTTP